MELMDITQEEEKDLKEIVTKSKKQPNWKLHLILRLIPWVMIVLILVFTSINIRLLRNEIETVTAERDALRVEKETIIDTPIVVSPIAPEIVMDIISSETRGISELNTAEYLFTDSARFSDSKQINNWNIPFTKKSFILKWDGSIKAGIDLSEIIVDVREDDHTIIIYLPEAKILSYVIDNDKVEVLDENNNIFNPITVSDKIGFDQSIETAMRERAIENGILDLALENAKTILTKWLLVNPTIAEHYTIEFSMK